MFTPSKTGKGYQVIHIHRTLTFGANLLLVRSSLSSEHGALSPRASAAVSDEFCSEYLRMQGDQKEYISKATLVRIHHTVFTTPKTGVAGQRQG